MKKLIASVAAIALVATPALAQTTNTMSPSGAKTSTKTMVTKGAKSTATTTVTTKVTPNKGHHRMMHHKKMKHHKKMRHHAMAKKSMMKKSTTDTTKS